MKRVLALSLSVFALANTITVSPTQAFTLPKPVKIAGKVASGLTFGAVSGLSALIALEGHRDFNQVTPYMDAIMSSSLMISTQERLVMARLGQSALNSIAFSAILAGDLAFISALLSGLSFKSAYNDIKQ